MIRLVMPIGKSLTDLYQTVTIYHLITCLMYYLFLSSLWISVEYFGKSENFQSIALYCVLFWENRQLPLCCGFILCVFFCGDLLGDTISSLWITVEYFGKPENFHSIALYCVLFWENRKLPLCCGFLLCALCCGYSNFTKSLSVKDIEELMATDDFNYLIIKSDDCYFGFNLLDEVERGCIFSIIDSKSTDAIDGWMVSMSFPEWVGDHSDWMTYEGQLMSKTWNESPLVSGIEESEDDDEKSRLSVVEVMMMNFCQSPVSTIRRSVPQKVSIHLIRRKNFSLRVIIQRCLVIGLVKAGAFQVCLQ